MQATIDEVLSVARAEQIDADLIKPGTLRVARSPAQLARLRRQVAEAGAGSSATTTCAARPRRARRRLHVAGASAPSSAPTGALQPAKLVTGLARAVERLGVTIYEDTTVRR